MHYVQAKGILSASNGMNMYRGCQHGCIYCDARSKCYQINHEFEDIEIKENAPELLEQKLKGKSNEIIITYCNGACLCYGRTVYSIQAQPTCSHTRENLADVRHSGE